MYHFTVTDLRETFLSGFHESKGVCVCVCVCVCETAREGEKGKNVNYLQHVCYIELDVETLEMNMTRSLF